MTSDTTSQLRFGWFIPTVGDTSAFGDPSATMKPSLELFTDIAIAAGEEESYGGLAELGTSHQPADPWLRPALDSKKNEVVAAVAARLRARVLRVARRGR